LAKHAKYACDTKCRDGTEVTHQLMVEMVVSQEWAPVNKPGLVTHTGVGRILRMHFGTILTERPGIGISWDNEAPPIYQDVPPSPPAYCHETMLDGECSIAELMEPLDTMGEGHRRGSTESSGSSSVQEHHVDISSS
jgi:arrestin-related trafficking adapter 1